MDLFEKIVKKYVKYLLGDCKVEGRYISSLRFSREIGKDIFVLQININDGEFKYIALTNLLLPYSMKKKGVSIEIINLLAQLCNEVGYDLFVTEITNEGWKQGLLRHGGIEDDQGDIFINRSQWVMNHEPKKLRFIEFDDSLILESEVEQFREIKDKCIEEIKAIFNSWDAKIAITQSKGYIEQIIADIGDETYSVLFTYFNTIRINDLINDNQLEDYLKEHQSIGTWF